LNPVVLLGAAGLTEAVVKETDRALTAHELIKVRIPGDDRDAREAIATQLADRLGAARVQVIGKLLVLYRPRPEQEPAGGAATAPRQPRAAKAAGRSRPAPPKGRPANPAPRAAPRRSSGRGR
jgi:putative YhbY family RNA-binding protein